MTATIPDGSVSDAPVEQSPVRAPLDNLSSEQRRRAMRAVKSKDTSPELALRRALRELGVSGYRLAWANAPGKPDIAFPGRQVAVFVDGGFWHGRADRVRPGRSEYWDAKIARNRARDARQELELRKAGWRVLRLWDDEVQANPRAAAESVVRLLHPFTAAEFFAGVGLARLGLEAAGGKVVWANDIEPVKKAVYAENFPAREYILADVSAVPGDALPPVDLAWASFPCTDLSLAGDRAGLEGDESGLVREFLRILEEMGPRRPRVVAVENVVGFVSSNGGRDVRESVAALNRLGYVCDAFVIDARWFVPQSRPRLFLVGWQDGIVVPVPEASVLERQFRPPPVMRLFGEADLRMRMGHLPQPEPRITRLDDIVERVPPDDPRWWGEEETRRCLAQMETAHSERLKRLAASETPRYATGYRRTRKAGVRTEVRDDGVAGCLRALRGGSSRQMLFECVGGDIRVRWLKAREYARLMGAPDSFAFGGATESQVMYAFGDAVCVDVVAWLTKHYLWAPAGG